MPEATIEDSATFPDGSAITTIRLKNGSEEFRPLVASVMVSLRDLLASAPIAFYDLVMLARDDNHRPFGGTGTDLVARCLLANDGQAFSMHDSVRNIVLSAVSGEGFDLCIGSPAAA